jgi:hypothetical protein
MELLIALKSRLKQLVFVKEVFDTFSLDTVFFKVRDCNYLHKIHISKEGKYKAYCFLEQDTQDMVDISSNSEDDFIQRLCNYFTREN